jgi:hypothetical protein
MIRSFSISIATAEGVFVTDFVVPSIRMSWASFYRRVIGICESIYLPPYSN